MKSLSRNQGGILILPKLADLGTLKEVFQLGVSRNWKHFRTCQFMRQWGLKDNPRRLEGLENLGWQKWRKKSGWGDGGEALEGFEELMNSIRSFIPGYRVECWVPPKRKPHLGNLWDRVQEGPLKKKNYGQGVTIKKHTHTHKASSRAQVNKTGKHHRFALNWRHWLEAQPEKDITQWNS